jgi:hypothetical protein
MIRSLQIISVKFISRLFKMRLNSNSLQKMSFKSFANGFQILKNYFIQKSKEERIEIKNLSKKKMKLKLLLNHLKKISVIFTINLAFSRAR